MKFMQRAAASETPQASPESTTSSSKKRKLEHSPAQGRLSVNFDQASVEAALAEQEAQRQAALTRHTTGDTHWVLNSSLDKKKPEAKSRGSNKIVYVGYGEIDSGNESAEEDAPQQGRTSTSGYKKARNKVGPPLDSDSINLISRLIKKRDRRKIKTARHRILPMVTTTAVIKVHPRMTAK